MLPIKDSSTPPLQVSKWLHLRVLMGSSELEELLLFLDFHTLHPLGRPLSFTGIDRKDFLTLYETYLSCLKNGSDLDKAYWSRQFSLAMTLHLDALFAVALDSNRVVVRPKSPVIQLQHNQFYFSSDKATIHAGVLGNTISWGMQFSFPQLWLSPEQRVVTLRKEDPTGNATLFLSLQRWLRKQTLPVTFTYQGKKIATQLRITSSCLDWIENHKELKENQLTLV